MPNGQWVAFEGYDTIHDCKKPVTNKPTPVNQSPANNDSGEKHLPYDDLDFPEIQVGKSGVPQRPGSDTSTLPPSTARTTQRDISQTGRTTSTPVENTGGGIPSWVWWVVAILIIFLVAKK